MLEAQILRAIEFLAPYITAATLIALPFAIAEDFELAVIFKFARKILPASIANSQWVSNVYNWYIDKLARQARCYKLSTLSPAHSWKNVSIGYQCEKCLEFIPFGLEPWMPWEYPVEVSHDIG